MYWRNNDPIVARRCTIVKQSGRQLLDRYTCAWKVMRSIISYHSVYIYYLNAFLFPLCAVIPCHEFHCHCLFSGWASRDQYFNCVLFVVWFALRSCFVEFYMFYLMVAVFMRMWVICVFVFVCDLGFIFNLYLFIFAYHSLCVSYMVPVPDLLFIRHLLSFCSVRVDGLFCFVYDFLFHLNKSCSIPRCPHRIIPTLGVLEV